MGLISRKLGSSWVKLGWVGSEFEKIRLGWVGFGSGKRDPTDNPAIGWTDWKESIERIRTSVG